LSAPASLVALVVRAGTRLCALPLAAVVETLRPLAVEPVAGAPAFVAGLALLRGVPSPVVDLARLLGDEDAGPAARWVTVRAGERRVALAVTAVEGVRALDGAALGATPPLLADARADAVAAVGRLDRELFLVLDAARVVAAAGAPRAEVAR
jgi:purine-binding chemotaxis protein CheW